MSVSAVRDVSSVVWLCLMGLVCDSDVVRVVGSVVSLPTAMGLCVLIVSSKVCLVCLVGVSAGRGVSDVISACL